MAEGADIIRGDGFRYSLFLREVNTLTVTAIMAVAIYLVLLLIGVRLDLEATSRRLAEFLGYSGIIFLLASLYLAWVAGALAVDILGLSNIPRRWPALAASLFYIENAAPFVGLLECFISIVTALLAYSSAGASAQAQSAMIANIAIALGASAAGCFIALLAHSLRAVLAYRENRE